MPPERIHKLADVYGVTREVPLTYVVRNSVDKRFVEDMMRDKHIMIHGSSKQGKTCLRRVHLPEDAQIRVQCTRDLSKSKLYEMILKKAGAKVKTTVMTTSSTSAIAGATGQIKGEIPLITSAKAEISLEREQGSQESTETQNFDIDLADPNDIARVLDAVHFLKKIVIEDFHYLDEDVQRDFAFDLKVFHEVSALLFIIIGVWLEANRLIMFNGDLSGRVTTIDADKWSEDELAQVVDAGENLLNIRFSDEVKKALVAGCQQNVGLLQEACYKLCENAGILQTQENRIEIGGIEEIQRIYAEIAASQSARYLNFLSRFAEGFATETKLQMYRWIAAVVVLATPSDLRVGLRTSTIFQRIANRHPSADTLQQNNVAQALDRVGKLQFAHKLQPLIFDYTNGRLRVVDANFILFVQTQPKDELLRAIGLPRQDA